MNLTEQEGDDFLDVMNKVICVTSGDVSPLPLRSKTLKKAFLSKAKFIVSNWESRTQIVTMFFRHRRYE